MSRWHVAVTLLIGLLLLLACSGSSEWVREDTEWFLVGVSADERTLEIVYTMSGVASECQRKGGVEARESEHRVTVRAHKEVNPSATGCTLELVTVDEAVTLEDPLGERELLGCLPGSADPNEDKTCRDLDRGPSFQPPERG